MLAELECLLDLLCEKATGLPHAENDSRHMRSLGWERVDRPPVILSSPLPGDCRFELYPVAETFESAEKMLFNELLHAYDLSVALSPEIGHDLAWTVRANYGTVLLPSAYGAVVEQVGNNPPWVRHDTEHEIELEAITESSPEELVTRGWFPQVRETIEAYLEILQSRPELRQCLRITLPDLQGPFDNFEHIRGNEAFLDLIDEPELAATAMRHIADTQVCAARYFRQLVCDGPEGYSHQHGFMIRGNILLRCDSVIMLSAAMYREQVAAHDNRVLEELGGGGIHSCGNISHLLPEYLSLPALQCLDLGQSELNDRATLYREAKARRIALIRLHASAEELAGGEFHSQYPTGVAAICRATSYEEALRLGESLDAGIGT